jgi:Ca2+-binding RTX toxin-like protein
LVDGLRGILDALDKTIRQAPLFKMDLPFVGDALRRGADFIYSTLVDPIDDALGDLQNLIRTEKAKRGGEFTAVDLLQYAMFELFEEIEGATNGLIDFVAADGSALRTYDDVDITITDNYDDLRVGIRAVGDIFEPISVDIDVGGSIPGVPISFDSEATLTVGMHYDLSLAFGVSYIDGDLDFYIDTARENELIIEAYGDINDDAQLSATLGFLDLDVTNLLKDGHKELSAALTVDLKDPNAGAGGRLDDGRLSLLKELRGTKFRDVVDAQFTARAEVSLAFVASFGSSTQFPRLMTDFHYSQVFAQIDLTTGVKQSEFGGTPEVLLGDIRLDLGSFISSFAGPILEEMKKITEPAAEALAPIVDPLPVVSDALGSPTSLLNLIEMFGGAKTAKYVLFFKTVKGIIDLINALPSPNDADGVMIRFGDYQVSGANRDGRKQQSFDQGEIESETGNKQIDPVRQSTQGKASGSSNAKPSSDKSTKKASGSAKGFLTKANALEGLRFPILQSPATAIGLFTGASNVDLVVFDLPELVVEASVSTDIWIWAPFLSATIGAGVTATVNLSFGFDSRGLNLFRDSGWENPEFLFYGLHIRDWNDDGTERVELRIEFEVTASVQIGGNYGFMQVSAGIAGGIFATVDFDMNDVASREGTYDGKVYIDELAYMIQRDPLGLFDVSAEVRAKVWVFVSIKLKVLFATITIFSKELTLVDVLIWRFDYHKHFQLAPLGHVDDGVLYVYTSQDADRITIHETQDGRVMVDNSGDLQRFEDVVEVVIDGGDGNDEIIIADTFTRKATIRGGAGRDNLVSYSDGDIYFDGGADDDTLVQFGDAGVVFRGGTGDDELIGGSGMDTLFGDAGNDRIYGDEAGTLYGTKGSSKLGDGDFIYAGDGDDIIFGQFGDDVIFGEGGNDRIFGQDGDDKLNAGAGRDQLYGQEGNDRLQGVSGVNLLVGGLGDDVVLGGVGADTIRWTVGDGKDFVDGGDGSADSLELLAAQFGSGAAAEDSIEVKSGEDGATIVTWRASILETIEAKATETIDIRTGLLQDNVLVRRGAQGVDATSILLDLGAMRDGTPGDRATDAVHILGEDDTDIITSVAVTADESTYRTHIDNNGRVFLQAITLRNTARGQGEEDTVNIDTGDGDDIVDLSGQRIISGTAGGLVRLIDVGAGDDVVIGSSRDELISLGEGDDTVDAGLGNDVILDGGGRDTYLYDAAQQGGDGSAVTFTVDGRQIEIEQNGNVQREYLWDIEVLSLQGTSQDDVFDLKGTTERVEIDGRDGSDAYLNRSTTGVTRFGVDAYANNTITLQAGLVVNDGDLLVGLETARLLVGSGNTDFVDLEPNSTLLRGVRSGVLATLSSYNAQTGELLLKNLSGVPEQGESFEVVGHAAFDGKLISLAIPADLAAGGANPLPQDGDLLTVQEVRSQPVDVIAGDITSATGVVRIAIDDRGSAPDFTFETYLVRDGVNIGTVVSWDATNDAMVVNLYEGIVLAEDDALSLTPQGGTGTSLSFGHSLTGAVAGDFVSLGVTGQNLDTFIAETTLRRDVPGTNTTYERIGAVVGWDNVTKEMLVELASDVILHGAADVLRFNTGNDDALLSSDIGMTEVTAFSIKSVSNGIAHIAKVASPTPGIGGTVYARQGNTVSAVGSVVATTATSISVAVDSDSILSVGSQIEAVVSPHAVLRVVSVDTALRSLTARLYSGTVSGGSPFSLNNDDNGQVTEVSIRNSETVNDKSTLTIARPSPTVAIGDILNDPAQGANGLFRVEGDNGDAITVSLLEGLWVTNAGSAALAPIASGFSAPTRSANEAELEYTVLETVLQKDGTTIGTVSGWGAVSKELTINLESHVTLAATDSLEIVLNGGTGGSWAFDFALGGTVSGNGVVITVTDTTFDAATIDIDGTSAADLPVIGELWTVTNDAIDALLYISGVGTGVNAQGESVPMLTFELLKGRLGTNFLDSELTTQSKAGSDILAMIGQFGIQRFGGSAATLALKIGMTAVGAGSAPVEIRLETSDLGANPQAVLVKGNAVIAVTGEGRGQILRGQPVIGESFNVVGTTDTVTLLSDRISLDDTRVSAVSFAVPLSAFNDTNGDAYDLPEAGDFLELTNAGFAGLIQVTGMSGNTLNGLLLAGDLPFATDNSLPDSDNVGTTFPEGHLGLKKVGEVGGPQFKMSLNGAPVIGTDGVGLNVDTELKDFTALGTPEGPYWVARDNNNAITAVIGVVGTDVTLLNGTLEDGDTFTPIQAAADGTWVLKSPERVATLSGAVSPEMTRDYNYAVDVEGDLAGVVAPAQGIIDRLAEAGSVTLYVANADGEPQTVVVTAVNMALGQIDISGPADLLKAGAALYDAGAAASFENGVPLELNDKIRAAIVLEREVDARGADTGARRFNFIESAPLEKSATVRVFDALESVSASTPLRLFDSRGNAVLVTAANAADSTISFRFEASSITQTGIQRVRLAFGDMALYAHADQTSLDDLPVLRLIAPVAGEANAMTMAAGRVAASGTGDTVKLSGLTQNLYPSLNVARIGGTTLTTSTIEAIALDTSELNVSIGDSGIDATTVLDVANAPTVTVKSVVINLDTAIVRMPAGFDGTFIEGQDVFQMKEINGTWTESKIGTVKVFKAGAGELHITLDHSDPNAGTQFVAFGSRIWSEYVAAGNDAHAGTVVSETPQDVKLVNKQIVWDDVTKGTIDQLGFVTGDSLISEDGRSLVEIGYFGATLDDFGNPTASNNLDLTFNRLRTPFQPFGTGQQLDILARDGATYTEVADNTTNTQKVVFVGAGSLDVSFGPSGWQIRLDAISKPTFEARVIQHLVNEDLMTQGATEIDPAAFSTLINDPTRNGLYLSSTPQGVGERGLDSGRVVGWDPDGGIVMLDVVESDLPLGRPGSVHQCRRRRG